MEAPSQAFADPISVCKMIPSSDNSSAKSSDYRRALTAFEDFGLVVGVSASELLLETCRRAAEAFLSNRLLASTEASRFGISKKSDAGDAPLYSCELFGKSLALAYDNISEGDSLRARLLRQCEAPPLFFLQS